MFVKVYNFIFVAFFLGSIKMNEWKCLFFFQFKIQSATIGYY